MGNCSGTTDLGDDVNLKKQRTKKNSIYRPAFNLDQFVYWASFIPVNPLLMVCFVILPLSARHRRLMVSCSYGYLIVNSVQLVPLVPLVQPSEP